MAIRKPLVLVDGLPAQLPPNDTLDATVSEVDVINLTNAGGVSGPFGAPVYVSSANAFQLARANAGATVSVMGLIREASIAASANGPIATDGVLTGSAASWDLITGETGGLVSGQTYFLSAAQAGRLTRTPPSNQGEYVLQVGKAISPESLEITIAIPIRL